MSGTFDVDAARSFEIRRTLRAPVELVYKVWTTPEYVSAWWGVHDSTVVRCEMDVRVGGRWRIDMRSRSGTIYPNSGSYVEVRCGEKLVYDDIPHPDSPAWGGSPPGPYVHHVTFEAVAPRHTEVVHRVQADSRADLERLVHLGMRDGLDQEMERLQAFLLGPARSSR